MDARSVCVCSELHVLLGEHGAGLHGDLITGMSGKCCHHSILRTLALFTLSWFLKIIIIIIILKFILVLAVLGLRCCVWAFSSCGEQGLLFVVVCGLLIAVTSLFL